MNKPSETQRTALITGCSRGIGRALTEHLLKQGFWVAGCSRGDTDLSDESFVHYQLDVTDAAAVKSMIQGIRQSASRLDVLINNAGIAAMSPFVLQPSETARNIFNVNVLSVADITREAVRLMRASKSPRIVNFSTVAVPYRLEGEAMYAASKAAVEEWTRVLAHELGTLGITVNAVGPTPIRTDLLRNVPDDKLKKLIDRQAIKRWGTVEDVLNVVDFFIRPESSFITGQVVYLGGAG